MSKEITKKEFKNNHFLKICQGDIPLELTLARMKSDVRKTVEYSFCVSNKCRYCGKEFKPEDSLVVTQSYWTHPNYGVFFYPSHLECKESGYASERYECQCIDASCNDCADFECTENRKDCRLGFCIKKGEEVKTYPQFCFGNKCFTHREDS